MFCFFVVTGSEYENMVEEICVMGFDREQVTCVFVLLQTTLFMF